MTYVTTPIVKRTRGINPGTTASSPKSIKLDKAMRVASQNAYMILKDNHPGLALHAKLPATNFDDAGGAHPDGGSWEYNNHVIAVFEAKYQGPLGNAIERWGKNFMLAKYFNPSVSYLTFATGAGVQKGKPIRRFFNLMLGIHGQQPDYNTVVPKGISVYLAEDGFEIDQITSVMVECVKETIKAIDA